MILSSLDGDVFGCSGSALQRLGGIRELVNLSPFYNGKCRSSI
jgi:hypothetical protein